MANIAIKYKGLTGLHEDLTIDNGQTMTQLRSAIIADEGITAGMYGLVSFRINGIVIDSTANSSTTLANAGIVAESLVNVSSARQANKQAYQEMTLEIAAHKRGGGNDDDTDAPYYRTLNVSDINRLPTKYSTNAVSDNTGDGGTLAASRPWKAS